MFAGFGCVCHPGLAPVHVFFSVPSKNDSYFDQFQNRKSVSGLGQVWAFFRLFDGQRVAKVGPIDDFSEILVSSTNACLEQWVSMPS